MDERTKTETYIRKMNTFAIGSLPVHFSVAKLFTFRWQYTLKWIWHSETLYELLGPEGNATMSKQQNAIAINAYEDALIEKFVGFQSVEFIEERKRLSYLLQTFIENQKSGGCLKVDQVKASKEYNDLVRLYKSCFFVEIRRI